MLHEIKKYSVQHPLLRSYIRFFWELHIENTRLNHRIIPQRNINLKFNLSETPQYLVQNGSDHLLDEVFFSGLQDHFINAHMKLDGTVHVLGVCFMPDGVFPFLKIPVSEFRNQMLGAAEIGFRIGKEICQRLKEAPDIAARIRILEDELAALLITGSRLPDDFRRLFREISLKENSHQLFEFCQRNNVDLRKMERMFSRYVGVSAKTYCTLNRFHNCLNQLLIRDYNKLSDLAYDNEYFDQMHFIREFKRFTGKTPGKFVSQNDSILQIGKLS